MEKNQSTKHWQNFWKTQGEYTNANISRKLNSYQRYVLKEIETELKKKKNLKILNAGCGIDLVSSKIAIENPEVKMDLLDISSECLKINKLLYPKEVENVGFIQGDIFDLSSLDKDYDLVFNTGVMEHFEQEEQEKIIQQVLTILRSGGKFYSFNPSAKGKLYISGMKAAIKDGTWPFGIEKPVITFKKIKNKEIKKITEKDIDGLSQFNFVKFLYPEYRKIIFLCRLILNFYPINIFADKYITHKYGTYLLLTIFEKK